MNRSALLVLLLYAIPHLAEARASGRAAAVVQIWVHPQPSCYPLHCRAQLKPQKAIPIRPPQMRPLHFKRGRNVCSWHYAFVADDVFLEAKPTSLRFAVVNLFDSVYDIRDDSGIGVFAPQFGPRRGFFVGMSQKL